MTGKSASHAPCSQQPKNNLVPYVMHKCRDVSGNVSPGLGTAQSDSTYPKDISMPYSNGPSESEMHAVTKNDGAYCAERSPILKNGTSVYDDLLVELDYPPLFPTPQNTSNKIVLTDGYLLRDNLDWDMEDEETDNVSSFSSFDETSSSDFLNIFETNCDKADGNLESGYSSSESCFGTYRNSV